MGRLIYLKKVKQFGQGGFIVVDTATCPNRKNVCISGDGEVYCPWLEGCAVYSRISKKEFLMTCVEPTEVTDDQIKSE